MCGYAPDGAKLLRQRQGYRREAAQKDLVLFVRNRCFCALIRGLRNPEAPVRETGSYFLLDAKSNQKAHGVCRPGRDKLSAKRKVSKGFNFVRARRHCGELLRGLQNLEVLCKENGLSLFALCKK